MEKKPEHCSNLLQHMLSSHSVPKDFECCDIDCLVCQTQCDHMYRVVAGWLDILGAAMRHRTLPETSHFFNMVSITRCLRRNGRHVYN